MLDEGFSQDMVRSGGPLAHGFFVYHHPFAFCFYCKRVVFMMMIIVVIIVIIIVIIIAFCFFEMAIAEPDPPTPLQTRGESL
jgi:hypothetical protein